MTTILIGLDDTDNHESPGTGNLARRISAECERRGMTARSVTRHQFLLDPRIPYTSHNSGACVAVEADDGPAAAAFAYDYVAEASAEGSDPGVVVADIRCVPQAVSDFGTRATREVLEMSEAVALAQQAGLDLRELGGSGQGIIGALASIGLHAEGNNGRFIDLPGLRDLPERVARQDISQLGIHLAHQGPRQPGPGDAYETLGWIRPTLSGGRPVLPVKWNEVHDAWTPVDTKRSRPLE